MLVGWLDKIMLDPVTLTADTFLIPLLKHTRAQPQKFVKYIADATPPNPHEHNHI